MGAAEGTRDSPTGIRYRLRLLFKSHVRNVGGAEPNYACLWCVQAGRTVREGDATVFLTADDLMRHLASHPQPLPAVTGMTVRYGAVAAAAETETETETETHDYDLHLPHPASPVPMPDGVARLATAVATRDHYRRQGRGKLDRPPKYDGEMLEFLEGARIVGVMFPEKWEGKWGLGRHDGTFGAFPTKAVEVRVPQPGEIPAGSVSGMSVVARWKWPPSKQPGTPWLHFDKGEVITNVQCMCFLSTHSRKRADRSFADRAAGLYADYWCWSGTNSKGKTGAFPRSHIDLGTLKEQSQQGTKPKKGRGLFSR